MDMQNVAIKCIIHFLMQMSRIDTKLQSLSAELAIYLNSKCRCDINSQYIVFNHSLCLTNHSNWFITSGLIFGTNTSNSTDIVKLLQMWVEAKSQVPVEGITLTAIKDCSVYLEEGELVFCERLLDPSTSFSSTSTTAQETSTPAQETDNTPTQGTDSTQGQSFTYMYIIFAAVVFVLVLLLVVVLCIVTVAVLRKKAHRRHLRYVYIHYIPMHNVY